MNHAARWAWRGAFIGALVGALGALLYGWPARWLQPLLSQASGGHLRWVATRGTLWDGQTEWQLGGAPGARDQSSVPGVWAWRLRPSWQSGPGWRLSIRASCCLDAPLEFQAHWQGLRDWRWTSRDGQLRLPLQILGGLGTPWNTLDLGGEMLLRSSGLHGDSAHPVLGALTLVATGVSSRASTLQPLGSYQADLSWPAQGLPTMVLRTLDGHLQLHGQGQIAQGRLRFRGQASASPDSQDALANLLNIIGRRQGSVSILSIG